LREESIFDSVDSILEFKISLSEHFDDNLLHLLGETGDSSEVGLHGANDHFLHFNLESVFSDFFLPEIHLPFTSIAAFCVKTISKNAVAPLVLAVLVGSITSLEVLNTKASPVSFGAEILALSEGLVMVLLDVMSIDTSITLRHIVNLFLVKDVGFILEEGLHGFHGETKSGDLSIELSLVNHLQVELNVDQHNESFLIGELTSDGGFWLIEFES
jgi:hypothetical protein